MAEVVVVKGVEWNLCCLEQVILLCNVALNKAYLARRNLAVSAGVSEREKRD